MLLLPMNPEFGENIAKSFCKYFSENIEDYRVRGERSAPMQGFLEQDEKLDLKIFYHTVLFFLTSYMQFENNFVRFRSFDVRVPHSNDEDLKVESSTNFETNSLMRFVSEEVQHPFAENEMEEEEEVKRFLTLEPSLDETIEKVDGAQLYSAKFDEEKLNVMHAQSYLV